MTINLRPHGVVTRRVVSALPANIGIQTDSHLTEDFILTDEIPVDPPSAAGASSVAPFLNPAINQSEALIIQNGELFYVCREPLSNSGWNFFGLGAGFPFIAPMNAAGGWAFANDGSVWQNVAGAWNAPATGPVPTATGTGTDGTIWGIVGGNVVVFDTTSLQWIDPPDLVNNAIPYVSIPSGSVDNLWVAEAGYFPVVYHYDPTNGWQNIVLNYENVPTTTEMVSVSVGFDARVFAVDNTAISSTAAWALSLAPKLMYVTLDESLQCKYEQVEGPFQLTGGAYTPSIALGVDQTLWLTDSFGTVWKYLPTSSVQWQRQMTPPAVSGTTEGWNIGDGAAMADSAGTVHAFCTCGGNRTGLYVTTLQNGDWRQPALVDVSGASASTTYGPLGIQRDATTGDVVVFAAASNGQLMLTRTGAVTNGVLLGSEQQFAPGQKLQLIQQNPDIWGVAGIVDNAVWSAIGTPADPTSTSGWVPPPSSPFNKATGIVADADTDSPITFVLDGWQNLWAWPDVTTLMTAEELTGTADSPF